MRASFLQRGLALRPERLRALRFVWNVQQVLCRGERGGFQYSRLFEKRLMRQSHSLAGCSEIVSHFPLFPSLQTQRIKASFYIDATLLQNFEDYDLARLGVVGPKMRAEAVRWEREQYAAAERVVCMSRWAARSVVNDYGIDPAKVHVVPAGANLDLAVQAASINRSHIPAMRPLRLGFIGKDWRRKNLSLLLDVADVLHSRGIETEVAAAGFSPDEAPRHPLLRCAGFIDKAETPQRFIDFVRGCHFACLFSSAEAFGISNREFLRLGVPVLARDVGGIADSVSACSAHLFDPAATAGDVGDVVEMYARNPGRYLELREHIADLAFTFTWDASVQKIKAIWAGSDRYCYAHADSTVV